MGSGVKVGYLLPTRERIMAGVHATRPIIEFAKKAEMLGYDSVWIGDSITAKPRHEALVMLGAIAAATERVELGSAVLLPMLRNPVLMAHQIATVDQLSEGRLILGVGTARDTPLDRREFHATDTPFEKRIGRMLEGLQLCKALWAGGPVDWSGRWTVEQGEIGPLPHRAGGPPIWGGGIAEGALKRAGRYFDGWFPSGPSDPAVYARAFADLKGFAEEAGRDADAITPAMYLTIAIDENAAKADAAINGYLESYYKRPAEVLRKQQAGFGGEAEAVAEWINRFIEAGCRHLCIRPVGDTDAMLERVAELKEKFA